MQVTLAHFQVPLASVAEKEVTQTLMLESLAFET